MKTKPFLLATAGSTVDGRTIDDKMLEEMASSYNPATYGARLNIEHIRGISGDKPFRAYGDVLELSTADVEVEFNGQTETRKGLFGVLDVNDDAMALNKAGQKVYPSIEIEPNFAGKGFAYLMGCALTDSPAAVGTERLAFNRQLPGTLSLTAAEAAALEFEAEERTDAAVEVVTGFFAKLADKFGLNADPKVEPKQEPKVEAPAAFDPAAFATALGETITQAFAAQQVETDKETSALAAKFAALEAKVEGTAAPGQTQRPLGTGTLGQFARTDC